MRINGARWALIALAAPLLVGSANAATLAIDTNADPSAGKGVCSLREAITSISAGADSGDCLAKSDTLDNSNP